MSNLQGWAYMEEQLGRHYFEEQMKMKGSTYKCEECRNEADYLVTAYLENSLSPEFDRTLCAKHADELCVSWRARKLNLNFRQRPLGD